MKSGILLLLLAFLLVAMPAVAADLGSAAGQELRLAETETKSIEKEVAVTLELDVMFVHPMTEPADMSVVFSSSGFKEVPGNISDYLD